MTFFTSSLTFSFKRNFYVFSKTKKTLLRSVTMDKWKDTELSKMKSGGNKQAKQFLAKQSDWKVNR